MNEGQRITATELILVLVGFAGLTALYFWPMVQDPDQVWSVGRDFFQNTWNLWWVDQAYENGQPYYETDRLFSPTGTSLAYHTISFTNSIPALALQQGLGMTTGAAHTVLFLSAFVFSGLGAWGLTRYLTSAPLAAFAAGVFYAFNPYHTSMITQLNNVQFQWMPLVLLGLLWMYDHRSWPAVGFTAVMLALAGYTDWYQPLFCVMAGGIILLVKLLKDKRLGDLKFWIQIGVMGGLAGALMYPGIAPLLALMGEAGGGELKESIRYIGEMQLTGMTPNGVPAHLFWPVILGWSTCFVLLYTLWRVRQEGIGSFWWLTLGGFLLLQGPYLIVLNQHFASIPMPMALFQHLPVLDMIRVPHRFLILLILGITGLIAYGLREFQIQRGAVATFLIIPILALELQVPKPQSVSIRKAPIYTHLAEMEGDFAVLEMPIDYRDAYSMWLQIGHGKRLIAGYTSHILPSALPALETDLMRALHPSESNTDILGLPEFLPVELEGLSEAQMDAWRRELVVDKETRFVVFHTGIDFTAPSRVPGPPETVVAKLKAGLLPYRFNPAMRAAPRGRKAAVRNFVDGLATHSTQARALIEKLFGPPDSSLGNSSTDVWDLRPWAEEYGVVLEEASVPESDAE